MTNDMDTITVSDLERHTGAILDRVSHGEAVTVTRDGRPVARLIPVAPAADPSQKHGFGALRHMMQIPDADGLVDVTVADEPELAHPASRT